MDDAICDRALAFARTFTLVNARITSSGPADPKCVARFGDSANATYGEVRLLMQFSEADKSRFLAQSTPEEMEGLKALLEGGQELRVICSAHDVVYYEFPGIEFD